MNILDEYSAIAENLISNLRFPEEPKGLYEPIKYALASGGKRIRPVLVLATAEATGGDYRNATSQAIGVEMFHNFTLLHDDVMDKSDMRRGKPTVHKKWDENTAILSGDAMLQLCTMYLTSDFRSEKSQEILSLFHQTAMEVYEGQQYDMDFEKRNDVSEEEYLKMIKLKTSVLLGFSCATGAIMSGSSAQTIESFYNYGINLGLAFQLMDDYLDTFGNPDIFGKKIGNDIITDKKTWLLINAMKEDKSGIIEKEINTPSKPAIKYQRVSGVYKALGLDKKCMELVGHYSQMAINTIENLTISDEAKRFFTDLAASFSHRIK